MQEGELLDVQTVAARLNVNPRTVLRMVGREEIPAIRVARRLRFRPDDLETYLQTHLSNSSSTERDQSEQILHGYATEDFKEQWHPTLTEIQGQGKRFKKELVQLELEKQRLELAQKKLELQKQQLDLYTRRIDHALDTADRLVHMLPPEADPGTKATILQTLLPGLLPPGEQLSYDSALGILKISSNYDQG
jgi:excisionase family DNA binding protein